MPLSVPLQITSFLEVIPVWLPPAAIATGFLLICTGMAEEYFEGMFGHWESYSPTFAFIGALCLTNSIAIATYVSIRNQDMVLLFVLFTFMSGRIIQGAIAARIIQKVAEIFFSDYRTSNTGLISKLYNYIKAKIKERVVLFMTTSIILLHTSLSITAVYVIGSGNTIEAIERFWIGFFFITIAGMVFDFRHFAHRVPRAAAVGLIVATTGAFLYSPVGFSTFIGALAPYLENPIPDWMRLPLGAIGFLFGVLIWAIFYIKEG